jgi:two-component system, chemotaxis family, CheB/CheR fusion protein
MKALQIDTVDQYVQILERQPEEADQLFKDLLIGVTQFFRDPEAFPGARTRSDPEVV